jgi:uncharacterized protein YjeT (DUF2065 family)
MAQASFEIVFSTHPFGLKARVRGEATFENTVAYWRAIAAALQERPSPALLLIDETIGAALYEEHWRQLVEMMKDGPLERLRIAHVKPMGLEKVEYCELFALEAGMHARVFTDEAEAVMWLRHGLS